MTCCGNSGERRAKLSTACSANSNAVASHVAGFLRDMRGNRGDSAGENGKVRISKRRSTFAQTVRLFDKSAKLMRLARGKAIPLVLRRIDDLAQQAQVALMALEIAALFVVGRNRALQRVDTTNLLHLHALHPTARNEVQGVAQQALRNALRSLHQAFHLQIDAGAQALGLETRLRANRNQCFGETDRYPPECAMLRHRLCAFYGAHGFGHFTQRRVVRGVAQPTQEAGLEAPPLCRHIGDDVGRHFLRFPPRRPRRQVGEEQV